MAHRRTSDRSWFQLLAQAYRTLPVIAFTILGVGCVIVAAFVDFYAQSVLIQVGAALALLPPLVATERLAVGEQVQTLDDSVQQLREEFTFTGNVTPEEVKTLTELLITFGNYLSTILPTRMSLPTRPKIHIEQARPYDAWFDRDGYRLVVGKGRVPDPHVVTHQYAHIFLRHVNNIGSSSPITPLEAALADYFACSFDNVPSVLTVEVPPGVELGIRELDRAPDALPGAPTEHQQGHVLATALWTVRAEIGHDSCDIIALRTWISPGAELDIGGYARRFQDDEAFRSDDRQRAKVSDLFSAHEIGVATGDLDS